LTRVEFIAILGSLMLIGVIVELVRERRLAESYSLLWLCTGVVLLGLSVWRELLHMFAEVIGIYYPPAALFVVGFGFVLIILLQFSVVITVRKREQKELAQQIGLLRWKVEELEKALSEQEEE
jgi:hypothetical protein